MKLDFVVDKIYEMRIRECVQRLKARYPEFLYPLSRLKFQNRDDGNADPTISRCLSTDGLTVFYDNKYLDFSIGKTLEYDIMHIVLHGMLGHLFHRKEYEKTEYRDICMDMQVMYLLQALGLKKEENEELIRLAGEGTDRDFSMKSYYRALADPKFADWLLWYKFRVNRDNHREWDYKERKKEAEEWLEEFAEEHEEEVKKFWMQAIQYAGIEEAENPSEAWNRLVALSKERNKRETQYGTRAGGTEETFLVGGKTERNYAELLQELTTIRELCREQQDSIDWMLYQYGFELNAGSPFVEPAEYSEQQAADLIVIAIDVSGSCTDGETMGKFWGETYDCVSQWSRNGGDTEFLVIQCDAAIQKEEWIKAEDFTECPGEVTVLGFGGTSFLPVFQRIEELKEEGRNVDALIYLTDGYGDYPEEEAEYPVYFILQEPDYEANRRQGHVPVWIQTIRLETKKGGAE